MSKQRLTRLSDALRAGVELMTKGPPTNPVLTGFLDLDDRVKNLGPKEVSMLAADSGVGKSTWATQAAIFAALRGHGVAYLNLEMPEDRYGLRTASGYAGVPMASVNGKMSQSDWDRMFAAYKALAVPAKRVVFGNAREHRTPAAIREWLVRSRDELAEEGSPLRLVVVDHVLQVMVRARSDDRDGAGKERADLLKDIAETLGVHVLALIHVTRDASKGGKMPTKNELASSAWFDRHADNIFVFHQKRNPDGTFVRDAPAVLSCQKSRWGEPFAVELTYKAGWFWPWSAEARS